jgi:TolB-like protein
MALLPFTKRSEDGNNTYFSDGISEEILNVLVKVNELKVAGRTSSFAFKDNNPDLRLIGETLGVAYILEGSVRKAGNKVRITAQLIKADDGFHVWSEAYDRELTDIFAIQDEIAHAITEALAIELELGEGEQSLASVSTGNMEAYDHYLEAKGLIARRVDFPRAVALLEEATTLDPGFAAGWATAAQAYSLGTYYDIPIGRDELLQKAESMAGKALEIEPDLAMAHSVLGDVYRDRYDWVKAKDSYLRALALNPETIEANEQYAQMLWRASYFEEALKYSSKATDLDPLSWLNLTVHAALRYVTGDRKGGWEDMQRALKIGGNNRYFPLRHALNMAISEGNVEKSTEYMKELASLSQDKNFKPRTEAQLAEILPILGSREALLAYLSTNPEQSDPGGIDSIWATNLFWAAYYGDYDLAETIFDKGTLVDNGSTLLDTTWFNYPIIRPLQNTVAYKRLIKRIRLDDYWRLNGFPANCRAVGNDDFACY